MKQSVSKKELVSKYLVEDVMQRCFHLLVLYQEKGRSTYDSFEKFVESVLLECYGREKFDIIKSKLVKSVNKK